MNTQHFTTNNNQKFPLSTEALAFMQEQIKLAYGLTDLAGANIIVREPTASKEGLVIFDGELLPLTGTRPTGIAARTAAISIAEHTETMSVEGKFEGNVRTTRIASYTNGIKIGLRPTGQQRKLLSEFTTLKSISTLMAELDEAQRHHVPTGAIMMWSGAIANIPAGWALCNGQNGTPDLRGRFIVSATYGDDITFDGEDYNYEVGNVGGKNEVKLSAAQSGLPAHSHSMQYAGEHAHRITYWNNGDGANDTEYTNEWAVDGKENAYPAGGGGSGTKVKSVRLSASYGDTWIGNDYIQMKKAGSHAHTINNNTSAGASQPHENRPVFYALAFIMKVI